MDKSLFEVLHIEVWKLFYLVNIEKKRKFELQEKLDIAVGIAYAMQYLHKMEIVHNDLTSKNIMVKKMMMETKFLVG